MPDERPSGTGRARYLGRALSLIARHPVEGFDRIRGRLEIVLEERVVRPPRRAPEADTEWLEPLHRAMAAAWPCPEVAAFEALWTGLVADLSARGLPGGFGHDADISLARAAWCLVRHLRPGRSVETGVARGVTSAVVLHGLERNANGHLWSIDLPPVKPVWHTQAGVAVPARLKDRWTYVRGASRRRLPRLLRQLRGLDLFIHDSLHTKWTMRFELESAWRSLAPGGAILVDDVDGNDSFQSFAAERPVAASFVVSHAAKGGAFGVALKPAGGDRLPGGPPGSG